VIVRVEVRRGVRDVELRSAVGGLRFSATQTSEVAG
jgi:hypothetical protein